MRKLIAKSIIVGFVIGTVFFAIAPLGLGISLIEALRPVLIPGVAFMHLLGINTIYPASQIFALFLNGLIYSTLVLVILVMKSRVAK